MRATRWMLQTESGELHYATYHDYDEAMANACEKHLCRCRPVRVSISYQALPKSHQPSDSCKGG